MPDNQQEGAPHQPAQQHGPAGMRCMTKAASNFAMPLFSLQRSLSLWKSAKMRVNLMWTSSVMLLKTLIT